MGEPKWLVSGEARRPREAHGIVQRLPLKNSPSAIISTRPRGILPLRLRASGLVHGGREHSRCESRGHALTLVTNVNEEASYRVDCRSSLTIRCKSRTRPPSHLFQNHTPTYLFVIFISPRGNAGITSLGVKEISSIYCATCGAAPNSHFAGTSSSGKKLRFRQSSIWTPD